MYDQSLFLSMFWMSEHILYQYPYGFYFTLIFIFGTFGVTCFDQREFQFNSISALNYKGFSIRIFVGNPTELTVNSKIVAITLVDRREIFSQHGIYNFGRQKKWRFLKQ